eukprot:5532705-Ditylum_brightwellii.AAC.1
MIQTISAPNFLSSGLTPHHITVPIVQISPHHLVPKEGDKITTVPVTPKEKQIKGKEHHTAILAGAAAVTQLVAAVEVDFGLTNPPKIPIVPPSKEPLCDYVSQINSNDILCGRGGGTNYQNWKFSFPSTEMKTFNM